MDEVNDNYFESLPMILVQVSRKNKRHASVSKINKKMSNYGFSPFYNFKF